jgi:hypothetical protein
MTHSTKIASAAPDGATTPSSLGEFLQSLADGPILSTLRLNRGKESPVGRRHARWLAAKQRAAFTKFPEFPE